MLDVWNSRQGLLTPDRVFFCAESRDGVGLKRFFLEPVLFVFVGSALHILLASSPGACNPYLPNYPASSVHDSSGFLHAHPVVDAAIYGKATATD